MPEGTPAAAGAAATPGAASSTTTAQPVTHTAVEAAATSGSFREFRAARHAERAGKPLPTVPVTPEASAASPSATGSTTSEDAGAAATGQPPAENAKQRREREADERLRQRVADAVGPKDAEIARLRAQLEERTGAHRGAPAAAASTTPAAAAAAAPPSETPDWKRYAAMADAPKLDQFESVEQHTAAMALFISDKRHDERVSADRDREDSQALTSAQGARIEKFVAQLDTTKAADPAFVSKLSADVKALKPFGALQPGEAGGPRNVIAEQIYDSPIAPQVLLHLSQHPEELQRLETMPAEIAALPARARVRAHLQWIVRQYGALEATLAMKASASPEPSTPKTISDVASVTTLGSRASEAADPVLAAAKKGDFKSFRAAKRARALAERSS